MKNIQLSFLRYCNDDLVEATNASNPFPDRNVIKIKDILEKEALNVSSG